MSSVYWISPIHIRQYFHSFFLPWCMVWQNGPQFYQINSSVSLQTKTKFPAKYVLKCVGAHIPIYVMCFSFWHCQNLNYVFLVSSVKTVFSVSDKTSKNFIELNKRHITHTHAHTHSQPVHLTIFTINNIGILYYYIQLIVLIDRFKCKFYNLWSYVL